MIAIIVNPAAGRGRGGRALKDIESAFRDQAASRIVTTDAPGAESRLASDAIRQGAKTIVVVGGDGTCSRVGEAILSAGSDCSLTAIPCGTGNDFAKTLGLGEASPAEVARLVAERSTARIDVGIVDGHRFLNSCGFGFDASVLEATTRSRFFKGNAVYIYSALTQLFTYRGMSVAVGTNRDAEAQKMLMLTVSNGRFLGGAFRIAPTASAIDGELDIAFFGDSNVVQRARLFAGALRGTHIKLPSVKTRRVRTMTLQFAEAPMMEVDGELRRARSSTVEIECQARALSVVAAPGAPL